MNDSNMKEKYMEYQFLMQQLQQLEQNISALDKHIGDLNALNEHLSSIKQAKLDSEILMPLGSGIFLKGELKNNSTVVMNVGNNVCVEKTVDEAKETVVKQLDEVTIVLEQLREETTSTMERLNVLQQEVENLKLEE